MTTTLIADAPVDVDAEGFLTDPAQWNESIAEAIAAANGLPELTERHWLVVRFMRERYLATGTAPSIRSFHCSGSVRKPSTSTSTGASAIRVVVISFSFPQAGTGGRFLPLVGMVGPMPGISRPGRRACQ